MNPPPLLLSPFSYLTRLSKHLLGCICLVRLPDEAEYYRRRMSRRGSVYKNLEFGVW